MEPSENVGPEKEHSSGQSTRNAYSLRQRRARHLEDVKQALKNMLERGEVECRFEDGKEVYRLTEAGHQRAERDALNVDSLSLVE